MIQMGWIYCMILVSKNLNLLRLDNHCIFLCLRPPSPVQHHFLINFALAIFKICRQHNEILHSKYKTCSPKWSLTISDLFPLFSPVARFQMQHTMNSTAAPGQESDPQ